MLATIPASFAYAPLSTFVPLYLLATGGSILSVAIAVSLFNAVAMISAFFWGKLADLTGKRKPFILLSYLGITLLLLIMYFYTSAAAIILLYAGIALFQQANPTAYNLLIMETDEEKHWSKNFSDLQMISNVGMILGLIAAAVVAGLYSLRLLVLVFGISSFASAAAAYLLVVEPMVNMTREESILKHAGSLIISMLSYPFRFSSVPGMDDISKAVSKPAWHKYLNDTFVLLCISCFIFGLGVNMFNTEYSASLHIHGLTESEVFLVIMVASVLQTVIFHYATRSNDTNGLYRTFINMNYIRAFSYVLVAASFVVSGISFLTANILLYAIIVGISYPIYYTTSYALLFESLRDKKRGNALGIYNGAGSIGSFLGALAAAATQLIGFPVLYLASGALVFASVLPVRNKGKKHQALPNAVPGLATAKA